MTEGGGHAKNMASKGALAKNVLCKRGGGAGVTKILPLSLVVPASVIMQTSVPEYQN